MAARSAAGSPGASAISGRGGRGGGEEAVEHGGQFPRVLRVGGAGVPRRANFHALEFGAHPCYARRRHLVVQVATLAQGAQQAADLPFFDLVVRKPPPQGVAHLFDGVAAVEMGQDQQPRGAEHQGLRGELQRIAQAERLLALLFEGDHLHLAEAGQR